MPKSKNPMGARAGTRSLPFALAVALLALLWAAGLAQAHGEQFARAEKILPLIAEEQPEELEGVTVRLQQSSMGLWLIAENNTEETLEIYDAKGEPFLRIGPEAVEYNRWAEEYYVTKPDTRTEQRQPPPREVLDNPEAEPEWVYIDEASSVAWRDRRVETEGMDVAEWVPMEVRQAREDADFEEWSVPVRLGEAETEVRGMYRYEAPPKGDYVATVTSEPVNPDITVRLLHGASGSADALVLHNRSGEPVTIFGASGEPAIRIGPDEVQINTNSTVGRLADLNRDYSGVAGAVDETKPPQWTTASGGSNATWLDPRLRTPDAQSEPDDPDTVQEVGRWEVPMEVAGDEERLAGVVEWQPSGWQPPEEKSDSPGGVTFRQVATVGAITVIPAVAVMGLLLGPGLYKRYRYRR